MVEVKVVYDAKDRTLTVWFAEPTLEYIAEETGEEVVLMKDRRGRMIGFERLNFSLDDAGIRVAFETVARS